MMATGVATVHSTTVLFLAGVIACGCERECLDRWLTVLLQQPQQAGGGLVHECVSLFECWQPAAATHMLVSM
jgi:hypothetical protein